MKAKGRVATSIDLICAAFAVLLLGDSGISLSQGGSPNPSCPVSSDGLSPDLLSKFRFGGRYFGCYSRAAKATGLSTRIIQNVAHGKQRKHFDKVMVALRKAMADVDASSEQPPQPIDPSLLKEFSFAWGRYYGLQSRLGRQLGCGTANVNHAIRGTNKSARVLRAVHAEMARVDAELAAKQGGAL